ncbi:MAG: RimK family alpha-L-glutamate ligase [Planctomycetes bacterium]|nr:RimK family alpha-L-glutamate ligase [Planctomycetota bacterium]
MKLMILSRKGSLYSTRRLRESAKLSGLDCRVVDPLACSILVEAGGARIFKGGTDLKSVDAVIPRVGVYAARHGIALIRAFNDLGIPTLNPWHAIECAKDKLACLQALARAGLPVPTTVITRSPKDIPRALDAIGGAPAILKLVRGTQGTGVMVADSPQAVRSTTDALWSLGEDVLLQRFITESRGRDLRVLVIGGTAVAAMRRHACEGEFRSNIHRGGVGEAVTLSRALERLAVQAARVVGLEVAGVDLLESNDGPLVLEVNSSPGFQGLEEATGIDIAGAIVEHAVKAVGERKKLCVSGPSR